MNGRVKKARHCAPVHHVIANYDYAVIANQSA